jgi:SAM-dependent methyltransferase
MTGPADRIVELYDRNALAWDATRGDTLVERAWLDRFVELLPPQATVLDIGCGSGEPMARDLAQRGLAVTGVDSSPAMIALCRSRLPAADFHVADMRQLDLPRRFDGILAWDSFFHLTVEDQARMFAIFARHAAAGAALMFTSGPARGEAIGSFAGEPLYHASLDPQEYRDLLHRHGFVVVRHVSEDPACGGHTVWLARHADQSQPPLTRAPRKR